MNNPKTTESNTNNTAPEGATNNTAPEGATNNTAPEGATNNTAAPAWSAALAGVLAAAGALAAGEFAAALVPPRPGPVTAVANRVVDEAPTWFVTFGKSVFGLADKPALLLGTVVISIILGAIFGFLGRRSINLAVTGFVAFGLIGAVAMATDAQSGPIAALVIALVSVVAGIAVLRVLFASMKRPLMADVVSRAQADPAESQLPGGPAAPPNAAAPISRRGFASWAAGLAGLIGMVGFASRNLSGRSTADEARAEVDLVLVEEAEELGETITSAGLGSVAQTPDISPLVVPNEAFYRIDTALLVPQVDPANWSMTIKGMVQNELTFSYDDLLERATTVLPVTLSCVSNEVGGGLVGNAVWQGVPLTELLDEAGVLEGATQISSRSVDGWDCGFPTDLAYDGRTALVAVAMNGEPLPVEHGFPARLVVSGLYGYVSATKWLDSIELTTLEDFNGYWIPRGWSKSGPVKTQSRIDRPRHRSSLEAGVAVPLAGVAWAPNTGIETVEVQVDDGPWLSAELGESLGVNAWRQWRLMWTPTPGEHLVRVRSTDLSGYTQTEERTPVAPNGASGWHTIALIAN